MGRGGQKTSSAPASSVITDDSLPSYTMQQVAAHNIKGDEWIVIGHRVYNISNWKFNHPGGQRLIGHFAGEDATDAFVAFHPKPELSYKYMTDICVGKLAEDEKPETLMAEFRELRVQAEKEGLFTPNKWFFLAHFLHIIAFTIVGWGIVSYFNGSMISLLIASIFLCTAQNQAGWLQHDLGASADWWNFRHFQHHAKPNIILKDPDISMSSIFLLGDVLPKKFAAKKRGFMPYQFQSTYWFFIGPPLLLPTYFHYDNIKHVLMYGRIVDVFFIAGFFMGWINAFSPYVGGGGNALLYYLFVRFLESHWFTWVTQMNHIPMRVVYDKNENWFRSQLASTQNVESSFFNDWFTGHLNFQVEHHLFPTMPRHNYYKIQPRVKALARKYGVKFIERPLLGACADIVSSLKRSSDIWKEAMHM